MSEKQASTSRPVQVFKAVELNDPAEIARLEAASRTAFGNRFVIEQVLDHVADPRYSDRRDLVAVILGLIEHLTPEQRRSLVQHLQAMPAPAANGPLPEGVTGPT